MKRSEQSHPSVTRIDYDIILRAMSFSALARPAYFLLRPAVMFMLAFFLSTVSYAEPVGTKCTAANARPMSVAEASRGGKKNEGACVRITGIADFWTLYGSLDDIYRNTDAWRDHHPRKQIGARIGIGVLPANADGSEEGWQWSSEAPHRITLIGRMHECGRDPATGKPYDELVMELNWCHHNSGSVLEPEAVLASDPLKLTRMTGKTAWRKFGDIVPVEKGAPVEIGALEYVRRMFVAAQAGDRRAILDLNDFSRFGLSPDGMNVSGDFEEEPWLSEPQDVLDLWFGSSDLVISQVARGAKPLLVRVFEVRWKGEDDRGPWACWAQVSLDERRWPISSVDTGNIAGRPYACVEMGGDFSYAFSRRGWSFEEPAD